MNRDDLGEVAYEAFRLTMKESGQKYPQWSELSVDCRNANRAAASAVVQRVSEKVAAVMASSARTNWEAVSDAEI